MMRRIENYSFTMRLLFDISTYDELRSFFCIYANTDHVNIPGTYKLIRSEIERAFKDAMVWVVLEQLSKIQKVGEDVVRMHESTLTRSRIVEKTKGGLYYSPTEVAQVYQDSDPKPYSSIKAEFLNSAMRKESGLVKEVVYDQIPHPFLNFPRKDFIDLPIFTAMYNRAKSLIDLQNRIEGTDLKDFIETILILDIESISHLERRSNEIVLKAGKLCKHVRRQLP